MHLIIKETLRLLRATLPSTIDIRHSIDKHCGAVRADPAQIYQIIMNLCTNAYQAMQKRGGILDVSLAGIEVDEELAATNENLHTGRYVSLTVHDTGHGMDPETRAQIFNPDFTTKENGQGTGLGLPIVRNIVSNHGGAISVHSEPGKGATFTIYLPRFEMPSESADQEEIGRPPQQYRIMFVDDEETVGEVVRQMLKRLGHEAVILNSSAKALEMFSNDPQGFDLIITDEIMPNLTGSELAGEFLRLRPDIPVVLTTGFVEPTSPEHLKEAGFQACMMKPFSTSDLFKIIDGVFSDPENPDKT
jgi:CheY-like chemotaxis protein/anti-sigma regulatory factor (Ser/Thr protein kinase)